VEGLAQARGITPDCGDSSARLWSQGPRGARDGLAQKVRPAFQPGNELDGLECTGDLVASPAARPNLRHPLTRARSQLARTLSGPHRGFQTFRIANFCQESTCPTVPL